MADINEILAMRIDKVVSDITIEIETAEGYLECPAEFEYTSEQYENEPFSYGGSRGFETEVTATLIGAQFGNRKLTRADVVSIIGENRLSRIEDCESRRQEQGDW